MDNFSKKISTLGKGKKKKTPADIISFGDYYQNNW